MCVHDMGVPGRSVDALLVGSVLLCSVNSDRMHVHDMGVPT